MKPASVLLLLVCLVRADDNPPVITSLRAYDNNGNLTMNWTNAVPPMPPDFVPPQRPIHSPKQAEFVKSLAKPMGALIVAPPQPRYVVISFALKSPTQTASTAVLWSASTPNGPWVKMQSVVFTNSFKVIATNDARAKFYKVCP